MIKQPGKIYTARYDETTTDVSTGAIAYLGVDFDRSANLTAYVNRAAMTTAQAISRDGKQVV